MKIEWEIESKYFKELKLQFSQIKNEELLDYENSEKAMLFIKECIRQDFEDKIILKIKNEKSIKEQIDKIFKKNIY